MAPKPSRCGTNAQDWYKLQLPLSVYNALSATTVEPRLPSCIACGIFIILWHLQQPGKRSLAPNALGGQHRGFLAGFSTTKRPSEDCKQMFCIQQTDGVENCPAQIPQEPLAGAPCALTTNADGL